MAHPTEKLHEALRHADIARAALRFIRPTPAQETVLSAVRQIEAAVRAALGALDRKPSLQRRDGEDMAVQRRLILKLSGLMAAGVVGPLEALARLHRPHAIDTSLLDAYGSLIHSYASVYSDVPPAELQPAVATILDRLLNAQNSSVIPQTRRRLGRLTSEAASFVGWLAYDLGRTGVARAHFTLAAAAARDAEDKTLWAFALASEGINCSPGVDGGPGDPRQALALLTQADRMLSTQPPHWAHAWVNAQAAAKAARLGDVERFQAHSDAALGLRERAWPGESPAGFYHWFPTRSREPDYLDDYFSGGLTRLDHPDAEPVLNGIVARTRHGHRMAEAQQNLMQLYIRHREYDAAAQAGLVGLAAAQGAGLERWTGVVRGVRGQAPRAERAFAELDDALATA